MVKILLKYNPDLNACDFLGKTALTYAIEADSLTIAKLLFRYKMSPWHDKNTNYIDVDDISISMLNMIKKVRRFWICLNLLKKNAEKDLMWKKMKIIFRNLDEMDLSELTCS